MGRISHANLKVRNANVASGIDKHLPPSLTLNGVAYTSATLKAVFDAHSSAIDASEAARTRWADLVQVERSASDTAAETYAALRSFVLGQFGKKANAILNDFGMDPPKPQGAKTVQTKAEGNAKRAATRAARHVMGARQRLAVKGNVTGIVVAPITSGSRVAAPEES